MQVRNETLLLAYIFESFWDTCLEMYSLNPAQFCFAASWALITALRKTEIQSELLSYIKMLLMFETRSRIGACHSIPLHRFSKEVSYGGQMHS